MPLTAATIVARSSRLRISSCSVRASRCGVSSSIATRVGARLFVFEHEFAALHAAVARGQETATVPRTAGAAGNSSGGHASMRSLEFDAMVEAVGRLVRQQCFAHVAAHAVEQRPVRPDRCDARVRGGAARTRRATCASRRCIKVQSHPPTGRCPPAARRRARQASARAGRRGNRRDASRARAPRARPARRRCEARGRSPRALRAGAGAVVASRRTGAGSRRLRSAAHPARSRLTWLLNRYAQAARLCSKRFSAAHRARARAASRSMARAAASGCRAMHAELSRGCVAHDDLRRCRGPSISAQGSVRSSASKTACSGRAGKCRQAQSMESLRMNVMPKREAHASHRLRRVGGSPGNLSMSRAGACSDTRHGFIPDATRDATRCSAYPDSGHGI